MFIIVVRILSNRAVNRLQFLIGIIKSQLFGEREEEMVQCVSQLQNKFIKKLSDNFCTDLWNEVRILSDYNL